MDIELDMFEVQLGASILLQFRTETGLVRVLADAGVKAKGYKPDHVLRKLLPLLDEAGTRHIDLVIGTHYDEDHLIGLVPIIEEASITIGEAWMPPVVNDTESLALDAPIRLVNLLSHQFVGENGTENLRGYLESKRADCELLFGLESERNAEGRTVNEFRQSPLDEQSPHGVSLAYFRDQLDEAHQGCCEVGYVDTDPNPLVEAMVSAIRQSPPHMDYYYLHTSLADLLYSHRNLRKEDPDAAGVQIDNLAELRQGAAKDAINAGVSGISCAGVHSGIQGGTLCPDGKNLSSRMRSWTSFWLDRMPNRHLTAMACSIS